MLPFLPLPLQHLVRLFQTRPQSAGTQVPTSNIHLAGFSADDSSLSLPSKVPVCPLQGNASLQKLMLDVFLKFGRKSTTCAIF